MPTSADLLLDTSAAIALVQPAHEHFAAVRRRCASSRLGLAGHAAVETLSVLTRMPAAQRVDAPSALRIIEGNFPASVALRIAPVHALRLCVDAGVAGGAVYDALVGLAAREAGVPLLSCDQRAAGTYRALAVPFELVQG